MRRRIEETSRAAIASVEQSLVTAITHVADKAVAELNRQHQIHLAAKQAATRALVVETVASAVSVDTVEEATKRAEE